jgi:hypothetical protein
MSGTIRVVSLETKLPMNDADPDADEVTSVTEGASADDVFERNDPMASRRL